MKEEELLKDIGTSGKSRASNQKSLSEMNKEELHNLLYKTMQLLYGKTKEQVRSEQKLKEKEECQLLEKIAINLIKNKNETKNTLATKSQQKLFRTLGSTRRSASHIDYNFRTMGRGQESNHK